MSRVDAHTHGPLVHTSIGSVRGVWEYADDAQRHSARIAAFRGIPYAEPPTELLRYAPPVRRLPWEGVLDTTAFGPTPMRTRVEGAIIPEASIAGDDILSVNVWTPSLKPKAALPVVVWIHGGGYISGSPASPWYDGRAFARDDVVLVTLSYRLGFRGFGWVEGATPNRGVLDWICALEWVRDNIASFGGDPGNVTIAGQSAGGSAVLTLLGSPKAAGLFHGGYAMSPAIADPSVESAKEHSRKLAHLAEVTPDVEGFLSISEAQILALQQKVTTPAFPHLLRDIHELLRDGLMIGPIADGDIVVGDIETAVSHGSSANVPLVIGTADGELAGYFLPGGLLDRMPRRAVLRVFGLSAKSLGHWLAHPVTSSITSTKVLAGQYATDAFFRSWVPRIATARFESDAAGNTWSYRFSWHADDPPYAGHCIDIPFVFDRLDAEGVRRVAGVAPPQQLADAVHGALVEFAKTKSPGWPPDTGGNGPTRIFDLPLRETFKAYASAKVLRPS